MTFNMATALTDQIKHRNNENIFARNIFINKELLYEPTMMSKKTAVIPTTNADLENNYDDNDPLDKNKQPIIKKKSTAKLATKKSTKSETSNNTKDHSNCYVNEVKLSKSYVYPIEQAYTLYQHEQKWGLNGDELHVNNSDDVLTNDELARTQKLQELMQIPFPKQRSTGWFDMRESMITASDGGTVLGLNPYEKPYDFILKKVVGKPFFTSLDCYHGKKYENVATMIYAHRMNVQVEEFGLCQHPVYKFLGASPDGIVGQHKLSDKKLTKYVGRMLEIKCPMRRKILMKTDAPEVYGIHGDIITDLKYDVKKGICPTYYWVQIQLQLQCCGLDECDFLQCEISEYDNRCDFIEDSNPAYPWISKATGNEKGTVVQLLPTDKLKLDIDDDERIWNHAEFIYQPRVNMTPYELDNWIISVIADPSKYEGKVINKVLYWKLNRLRNITIKRDDRWFEKVLPQFRQMWEYVEFFRKNKDKIDALKKCVENKTSDEIMRAIDEMVSNS